MKRPRRLPVPSRRVIIALAWIAAVGMALLMALMLVILLQLVADNDRLERRADSGGADRADLRTSLTEQQAALGEANNRLRRAGKKPVAEPDLPPSTSTTTPGLPGLHGPSCVEELGLLACRGPAGLVGKMGAPGKDGNTITGPRGLRGPVGKDGRSIQGPPGESVTGPQGPTGTGGPPGPAGAPGQDSTVPGPKGEQGPPGVDGSSCPNTQTITYDDDGNPVTPPASTVVCVP